MNRIVRPLFVGAMAACALLFSANVFADASFGYFDSQDQDERHDRNEYQRRNYDDPYDSYQRMQRQSDNVRRQQENLSRDHQRDIREFQQSKGYMRNHRH